MNGAIKALASYLPARVVTNEELSRTVDTSDEWIRSHTGIAERRLAGDEVAASDLGILAAGKLLDREGIDPETVDLVIGATSTPDYAPFPATACIIQDRLGCSRAGAFDLQAGCTGFVYAVEVAASMIGSGSARRVLVVGAEKLSALTNWNDRATCVLFGDGAGAALIEPAGSGGHEILASTIRSDGSGDTALIRSIGGSRHPFDPEKQREEETKLTMDGKKVYLFAVDALVRTVRDLAAKAVKLRLIEAGQESGAVGKIDWIVPHQANLRIIEAAAKRLSLPLQRFYTNLDRYANTSAASIPIALTEMEERGLLERGALVLTVGFGAGLTYGGNLIRW
ncbi:MAG: beta-ketoacyl-ACP synthase III [Alkalispirochaetaceae bacterium]